MNHEPVLDIHRHKMHKEVRRQAEPTKSYSIHLAMQSIELGIPHYSPYTSQPLNTQWFWKPSVTPFPSTDLKVSSPN